MVAIVPLLRNPRPRNWKHHHYYCIAWSYVGLIAAAATELVVRMGLPATRGQAWAVSFAVTIAATAIGYIISEKNRPIPEQGAAVANTMQHDGVPS